MPIGVKLLEDTEWRDWKDKEGSCGGLIRVHQGILPHGAEKNRDNLSR